MRNLSLLSIILMIFLLPGLSFAKESRESKVFKLIKQKDWSKSYGLANKTGNSALKKIVLSQQYLDSKHKGNSFEKTAKFLMQNPHWPQSYLLRIRAENLLKETSDEKLIFKWFNQSSPVTGRGHKYYALAAGKFEKDPKKLAKIIKSGWHNGNYYLADQKKYHKKFRKYLTLSDHIKKIDNHIFDHELTSARNSFYLVNAQYKKSFRAQIDLSQKHKKAQKTFKRVAKKYYTPGLIYQYLNLRKKNLPKSSSEFVPLLKLAKKSPEYADRFWKVQAYIAREFIERKKYNDAYKVASLHFTKSPANQSEAEFLSGWLAISFLKKPSLAIKHFRQFNRVVRTPISKSRGIYWLARAHEAAKDRAKAQKLYDLAAAKYPYTFYGQMAVMELGKKRMLLPSNINLAKHKAASESHKKKSDITHAAQLVSRYGPNVMSQAYISSAVKQASTTKEILGVAGNVHTSKNVHHMAWLAKKALQKHVLIKNHAYPTPYKIGKLPIETPLTYSIIRQESVFDQHAVSSANARGLMQLIKATACDTAKSIAKVCKISKLTKDPKYNMILGSNYLSQMIKEYQGSYILAIAAYNGGPHNVDKWIKAYGDPRKMKTSREVLNWLELIPFHETRNYVQRVLENLQIYRTILDKKADFKLRQDLLRKT